jgi:alkanesulfonate monooxygenase
VADAIVDYYEAGVSTILIRGFDPLNDAIDYGRELLPLVREKVDRLDRAAAAGPVVAEPVAVGARG